MEKVKLRPSSRTLRILENAAMIKQHKERTCFVTTANHVPSNQDKENTEDVEPLAVRRSGRQCFVNRRLFDDYEKVVTSTPKPNKQV